jgi:hypothetical protein
MVTRHVPWTGETLLSSIAAEAAPTAIELVGAASAANRIDQAIPEGFRRASRRA